jgi:UDP:flavonoid glycosyltransferase YjiC (YdhE family)
MTSSDSGKRIVFTAAGSLGDLHPYIAVALGLKARGHRPCIATFGAYKELIQALGIEFRPMRAIQADQIDSDVAKLLLDSTRWWALLVNDQIMPQLRYGYQDICEAADGADLMVAHPLSCGTPLAAEKLGLPWVSTCLAPVSFWSAYDPCPLCYPRLFGFFANHRVVGPAIHKLILRYLDSKFQSAFQPWRQLRREIGLPDSAGLPFGIASSPTLHLALFSELLGARQRDWPANTEITGFPFYDNYTGGSLPAELASFLDNGPPPLVFTLSSLAVMSPGRFYEDSVEAAKRLGRRAVLVTGSDPKIRPASLPEGVMAVDYAPFSELFPRAAAVVHHGGVGTTAQAMRAGRPMLIVPFFADQPDNADRVGRLGMARTVARRSYSVPRAVSELSRLLGEESYALRANEVGRRVQHEDGIARACAALERLLQGKGAPRDS